MMSRSLVGLIVLAPFALGCSSSDGNPTQTGGAGATANPTAGGNGGLGNGGGSSSSLGGKSSNNGGATTLGGASTGGAGGSIASVGGATASGGAGKGGNTVGGAANTGGAGNAAGASRGGANNAGAPGCNVATPAAATGAQNLTIQVAGQERSYVLFVPTTYNGATPMPLVFAWHGLGGSGTMARQYFGLERAANNQAIFVYPTGLVTTQDKTGWTLTSNGVDVQLFDALLADIASKYCIDRNRVFSTGHSFGGMMTNALGCYRGNVLRAIAPVAGMPPFGNPTCSGAVAAWIAHGENDGTVDYTTGGVATRDLWLKLNGCSTSATPTAVTPSPCVAYQECSAGHPVHWCVHQSDHNWPSFGGTGIWAFFDSFE